MSVSSSGNDDFGLDAELARVGREVERLRDQMAKVSGKAEAAGGLVAARVGADGRLVGLKLQPRVMRLGSDELAEAIVAAVNAALEDGARQMRQMTVAAVDDGRAGAAGTESVSGPGRDATLQLLEDLNRQLGQL
ncbi:YbaB/EbfC family nucleoid-associated protein [Nonomuraea sp. NPDC048916]|uniref:YbaB/EbfC family nucleoid-associated protein n=1 Tax=Nonomuraea sp. NPDC048916 TaxID=3154232 RepID=UPI0034028516